ncbi:hypothetical protein [Sphingomonas lenta]|uniref:APCDD1 domain-containing protein n=1 Tax=Sphingomonas lenta TaxID=1141887 RepID=A0A2A2SHU5_9SPHN|nr:hypothetical protein [Sphingomonas lenta]PAX08816.1 hypothetical protein CKY28_05510 [Sphingomonas lenta]
MIRAMPLAAIAALWPSPVTPRPMPFTNDDLVGEWWSGGCRRTQLAETGAPVFLERRYQYSRTNYVVRYSFFEDEGCRSPLYSFVATGPYELGRVHPTLPDTREATIFIDSMFYVAESEAGRRALGACGRRLAIGAYKDVTETGCGDFPPRRDCIGDYELFRVEAGVFYPGLRTADMCRPEGRPRATQTVGAAKQAAR